jgi:hypothetical protein
MLMPEVGLLPAETESHGIITKCRPFNAFYSLPISECVYSITYMSTSVSVCALKHLLNPERRCGSH